MWSSAEITLDLVRRALAAPRPGRAAQERMSPRPRVGDRFPFPPQVAGKDAGVLILIFPRADGLYFFLTRRTETVGSHKGQISLPGGGREVGDESLRHTALRETYEELGIPPDRIEILDEPLTPLYIPVSTYIVTAYVGYYCCEEPPINSAAAEVFEVIPTPLAALVDDSLLVEEEWELRGFRAQVPFFMIHDHKVWGATAMILAEFAALLRTELVTAPA